MTDIKTTHDCCTPDANLSEVNDLTPSDIQMVQDCCLPAIQSSNVIVPLSAVQSAPIASGRCPVCKHKGKTVDGATVKAMLAISLMTVQSVPYLFCRETDCPVVYFSADGLQTFTTEQVRERVFQKEQEAEDVFVCYCFRHTPSSIRDELIQTGQSTVVEAINVGIQAGQCACDLRNPQGACCLGNVSAVVKRIQQELNTRISTGLQPESEGDN